MNLTLNMEKTLDASIDAARCVNCDACGSQCPVGAIGEAERSVEGMDAAEAERMGRSSDGCPLDIAPQVLAEYIRQGRTEDAAGYLYGKNPLAALCAQVCGQYCSARDKRTLLGTQPVNVAALERYITDRVALDPQEYTLRYKETIAIIGGGPAGLAAAHDLASRGYSVTIFERDNGLGGSMAWGIPGFRLDKDKMDAEIGKVVRGSIETRTGVTIGEDVTLEELRETYDAVILAIGASKGAMLSFEGTEGDMVLDGVSILRTINLEPENEFTAVGDTVVVIGGSRFAVDVSRTLARKGKTVSCVAMEAEEKLPITAEERKAMAAEGIDFRCKAAPRRIVRNNGQITEVDFGSVIMRTDEEGKTVPVITEEDSFYIPCDTVVFAVGRQFNGEAIGAFSLYPDGAVQVDKYGRTSQEKVFACGDITGVSNSVVGAMKSGKRTAEQVDAFLRGRHFPVRRAGSLEAVTGERIIKEEIAMIRPQKETTIFSRTGKLSHEPAEDIIGILREAGLEETMPLLVDRKAEDFGEKKKVAVIGGGIAGITAAIELAKKGYAPTLFEKTPALGGQYRWLASDKRIDAEGLEDELAKVSAAGIEVVCSASAGIKPSLSELKAGGFGAILFALGESRGIRPDFPGAYSVGIFEMVSLASRLARDLVINAVGGNALVTGSDAMAVDVARKLKEYAEEVTLICRCSKEQLEQETGAARAALEEGVNLVTGTELVGVDVSDGTVKSATLRIIEKDLEIDVPCDTLVIGDTGISDTATIIARNPALKAGERGHLLTDENLCTPINGVLSIGDLHTSSVQAGKLGAAAVDSFFTGEDFELVEDTGVTGIESTAIKGMPPRHEIIEGQTLADKGFEIGKRVLSTKQARQEATRYICVGYHAVDGTRCLGCGICTAVCPEGAIEMVPCREVE